MALVGDGVPSWCSSSASSWCSARSSGSWHRATRPPGRLLFSPMQGSLLAFAIAALAALDPSSCGSTGAGPPAASCGDLETCATDSGVLCTDTQSDNAHCGG